MGCSGWNYRDWRGRFYPTELPVRSWFEYYASQFDTVELNSTFYRLPTPDTVRRWAAAAPPGFVYAVKLGQFGSHRMKLRDARRWLPNHLDRVEHLGDSLGPTLVQLPPRWQRDVSRLAEFLAAVPTTQRWALEVRDRSWLHDDVFELLREHRVALCLHDLLEDHPWELTAGWTYLRFHGPAATTHAYHGAYTGRRLWRVAERVAALLDEGLDVYSYFNNDVDAAAVGDARWLRQRLADLVGSPR